MTTKRSRSKKPQLKRRALSAFARELLHEWRRLKLPLNAASVIVGVSGGSDSVSLLLALDELLKSGKLDLTLIVAHLNHQLRLTSQADARWVSRLAKELGYQKSLSSMAGETIAQRTGDNLEQAARRARYDFLARTARRNRAQIILTAHTMNDQAETVLLNLLRGSGLDGWGGIEPVRIMERSKVSLARPLLSWATREHTMSYCEARDIDIRNDEMNQDEKFARVRVRKRLLPLMQSFNPRWIEPRAGTAEVLREDNRARVSINFGLNDCISGNNL